MRATSAMLWVGLIGAMTFGLFQLKYAVQAREDELARLNRNLIASEEAIHVLHADWSYFNRPERLAALAERHLGLGPMDGGQIGAVAALPPRSAGDGWHAGFADETGAANAP